VIAQHFSPMRLLRVPEPFDHPDFVFEPKIHGFRALAHIEGHRCSLVSRNGHVFRSWPQLAEEMAHAVRAESTVLLVVGGYNFVSLASAEIYDPVAGTWR
jgi:ATP-dependent DNA ligase